MKAAKENAVHRNGEREVSVARELLDDAPVVTSAKSIAPLSVGLKDAAKLIGISDRKLWEMADQGEVPSVKLGGRLVFRVATLDAWLQERERASSGGCSANEGRIS